MPFENLSMCFKWVLGKEFPVLSVGVCSKNCIHNVGWQGKGAGKKKKKKKKQEKKLTGKVDRPCKRELNYRRAVSRRPKSCSLTF